MLLTNWTRHVTEAYMPSCAIAATKAASTETRHVTEAYMLGLLAHHCRPRPPVGRVEVTVFFDGLHADGAWRRWR
jgi:hypothetical protein